MDKTNSDYLALVKEAESENTPGDRLEELAALSDDLAIVVTNNPNTPIKALFELGEYFPQELLNNSSFELLLSIDLPLLEDIPLETLIILIQQPIVSRFLLKYAANHREEEIAEIARMQISISGNMLEGWDKAAKNAIHAPPLMSCFEIEKESNKWTESLELLANFIEFVPCVLFGNSEFKSYIGENLNTPKAILKFLAQDPNSEIRMRVAANPNTPTGIVDLLANDEYYGVRYGVAVNPNAPPHRLQSLINNEDIGIVQLLATNPSTPADALQHLSKSTDRETRQGVAKNYSTPVKILELLAKDSSSLVRYCVATNLSSSDKILKSLAKDSDEIVVRGVAQNPSTPVELLKLLANNPNNLIRYCVAENPSTPVEILKLLANYFSILVPEAINKDNNKSQNTLYSFIANCNYSHVACADIAKNPNMPMKILEMLAQNSENKVRQHVAINHNISIKILKLLAKDSDMWVRKSVAENYNTPVKILKSLASDSDSLVRESVAINPQCTHEIKKVIFKNFAKSNTSSFCRVALFMSEYAESSVLAEHSNSISWLERYAIACNSKTPKSTLKKLAQDGNRIVRATAKESVEKRQ